MKTLDAHMTRARELGVLYMDFRLTSPFSEIPFSYSFRLPFLSFFAGAQTQKKRPLFKKSEHEVAFPRKMA